MLEVLIWEGDLDQWKAWKSTSWLAIKAWALAWPSGSTVELEAAASGSGPLFPGQNLCLFPATLQRSSTPLTVCAQLILTTVAHRPEVSAFLPVILRYHPMT